MKTKPVPCQCNRLAFPHRRDWRCVELADTQDESDERTLAEINAEMLALHDAAEARAINRGY